MIIQGVYIKGDGRPSETREIQAINEIVDVLKQKPGTKAEILPLLIVDKQEIPQFQNVTDAYERIRNEIKIGTQYEWLGRYAMLHPGIELGAIFPDGEFSGVRETINKYSSLIQDGDSYRLDLHKTTEDCKALFGNYGFPLVFTKETEMVKMIEEWGYEDVMSHIWFCHRPYKGEPCGICRPCEQKMEGNMEFLLPVDAQKRYRRTKMLRDIFGERGRNLMFKMYKC